MVVCPVPSPLLSIVPSALEISRVLPTAVDVTIEASLARKPVSCPSCGLPSRRLHSRYPRILRDLPWQGRPATIRVAARRFRCLNTACARKTFAEHLGPVAAASARRTTRLGDLQRHVAFALGGEAAARLAERLAIPASADTLLRLIRSVGNNGARPPTPRVLAVDDWAWRRGHRYGTVLVDLERNAVVDLLPDRQAETLAAWLRQHPGIEIVARDRAGAYADGVRQGAPDAVQVADRWHMLRNLGDAVRSVVDHHHAAVRRAARQAGEHPARPPEPAPAAEADIVRPSTAVLRSQACLARRQGRYEQAALLHAAGCSISGIALRLGAERKTIRRWLRAGGPSLWRKPPRAGVLSPHIVYLERRWAEGCRNAARLWRELVPFGFAGRPGTVHRWVGQRRRTAVGAIVENATTAVTRHLPSTRQVARMLMTDAETLPEAERALIGHLVAQVPGLSEGIAVAKRLSMLLRHKSQENLGAVLDSAAGTPLAGFAAGLRRDVAAVQAALDLPWTTSPAEGQINRIKMIKRTMYGRAGFQLLRARVLHAA